MLVAIDFTLAARCGRCTTLSPVGGVRDEVPCVACASPVDVAACVSDAVPGGRSTLFDERDVLLGALLADPGEPLFASRVGEDSHRAVASRRDDALVVVTAAAPACRACRAAIGLPASGATEHVCTCGNRVAVRWPDAQTRGWDLRLSCVLGETPASAPAIHLSGIVVPCGGCGAPLSGPVVGRTVTCEHCATPNLLPDAIFMRLVPDAPPQPFTLLYDVDDKLLAKVLARTDPDDRRWRDNARYAELQKRARGAHLEHALHGDAAINLETARELAGRDLTAAEAKHVDNWLSNVEREKLVGGRVAQALIDLWAHSSDAGTRAVAAKLGNPERFLDDPDADVRAAVAARKHLPAAAIAKLANDGGSQVRAAIAARKDCPPALLKKLGRDGDSRVRKAAHDNPAHPPGLFKKLFGG